MIAALGVLVIVAMIYFFAKNERYRRIKLWGQPVYASLILFAYMLFVTALPTGDELMSNLAFAATETCALVIPFVIFHFGMDPKKKRGELCDKLCYTALISTLVIVGELAYLFATDEMFLEGAINKNMIVIGWGISNCVGGMLTLAIPLLFLGAQRSKHTLIYFFGAVISYAAAIITLSRNALVFGTATFCLCCIVCSFFGKKKRAFRIITLTLICICAVAALIYWDKILEVLDHYVKYGMSDSGRFSIWRRAWDEFTKSPIFGNGFHKDSVGNSIYIAVMPALPHNTPLALLGGGGLLLFGAYAIYRLFTLFVFLRRPTLEKTLLGIAVLTLLVQSLLDNFFLNFYPTFMYTVAICIAMRDEGPRHKNGL